MTLRGDSGRRSKQWYRPFIIRDHWDGRPPGLKWLSSTGGSRWFRLPRGRVLIVRRARDYLAAVRRLLARVRPQVQARREGL